MNAADPSGLDGRRGLERVTRKLGAGGAGKGTIYRAPSSLEVGTHSRDDYNVARDTFTARSLSRDRA